MLAQRRIFLLRTTGLLILFVIASWFCGHVFGDQAAKERYWWAFTGGGTDKPGCGYVLIEERGKITGGHFFLLMTDPPENESGRFFHLTNIKEEGELLTSQVKLFNGQAGEHGALETHKLRMRFRDKFAGNKRIKADVTFDGNKDAARKPEHIVFVLQGDQWE